MEFAEDQTLKAMSMYVVVLVCFSPALHTRSLNSDYSADSYYLQCIITLFAFTFKVLYNIYLHPLSAFKGPKYLIASEISLAVLQLHGTSHYALRKAHEKYGCIVRISPSTLSFISPSAWNDIYGHRKGHPNLPKDPLFFNESLLDKKTITMTSDFDAVPIRRAMNPAFSHKALLEQEPMVQSHFKRLVAQLFRASYDIDEGKSRSVDLQKWFTWSMFDINADFSFGEDMGCVASGSPQQWVQFVTDNFYAATFLHQFHKFLPFKRIPDILVPKSLREQKERHNEASLARVRRRMDRKTDRHDFMYHFLEHARKNGLSTPVIEAQASIIILAGSETSAVALSASIYHILNNSHVYKQLCEEIRDAFTTAEGITYNVVSRLPYLEAVVQESLRLHTPIANGFNRVVADPKGAMINGHRVPQGASRASFF